MLGIGLVDEKAIAAPFTLYGCAGNIGALKDGSGGGYVSSTTLLDFLMAREFWRMRPLRLTTKVAGILGLRSQQSFSFFLPLIATNSEDEPTRNGRCRSVR